MPEALRTQSAKVWEQAFLRPGVYHGHPISRDDLQSYAQNTNALIQSGYSIPVFTKHKRPGADDGGPVFLDGTQQERDALDNVGWLRGIRVDDTGVAHHQIEVLDPEVKAAIDEGRIRFTSPELALNYRDYTGKLVGKVVRHVALTPTPRNPQQGPFIAMSEPNDELLCVQFSLEDLDEDQPTKKRAIDGDEGEGEENYQDDGAMETMKPNVRTNAQAIAKQVMADLEAAGIAAPRGVDPLKDTLGFLAQLSTALRQRVMTQGEEQAKSKDKGGDMSVQEEGISQYSELTEDQLIQFSEGHQDAAIRAMAGHLLKERKAAAAERLESRRGNLRSAIEKAPIAKFVKTKLTSIVDAVQFSEDGADEPVMRMTEVVALLTEATPKHLQFSEHEVNEAEDDFLTGGDSNQVDAKMADQIANRLAGGVYQRTPERELQLAGVTMGRTEPQQSGRRR